MELDFDVEKFLEDHHVKNVENIFIQGEERLLGKINEKSGFNVLVSDNLNSKENTVEIHDFITTNEKALLYLQQQGISSSFDIGCSVGSSDSMPRAFGKSKRKEIKLLVYH
jgi:hypothetical protein